MKFNLLYAITAASILIAMPTYSAQKIYKWTDEHGKVHYSDKPPVKSSESETITIEPTTNVQPTPKRQPQGSKVAPLDTNSTTTPSENKRLSANDRVIEANNWLQSSRLERQQKQAEKARAYQRRKKREAHCDMLKQQLDEYQSADFIFDVDDNGYKYYLTDDEIDKLIIDTKAGIESTCQEF